MPERWEICKSKIFLPRPAPGKTKSNAPLLFGAALIREYDRLRVMTGLVADNKV